MLFRSGRKRDSWRSLSRALAGPQWQDFNFAVAGQPLSPCFFYKWPVQNRIKIISMITLTPLMGPKPHFLLCGQTGRLPTSATRTNTARTAINNILFLPSSIGPSRPNLVSLRALFRHKTELGSLSGAAVKLHSSNRKQLCERVNSQCYAQRNIGERQDRRNEGELTA